MPQKALSQKALSFIKRYTLITLGALLFALAFAWCFDPARIGFGGVTGIGQMVNYYVPAIPIGAVVIVLNIPLFFLSWKLLGSEMLVSSVYAMTCSSVFIDVLAEVFHFAPMNFVPAALAGGVLVGAGLGLVILQGASTGGTDLLARLLKLKIAWLPMGKLLLLVDLVVIAAAAVVFGSVESGIYGLMGLFLSTAVMDKMLYGLDTAKVAYIISTKPREIIEGIVEKLQRGVTLLEGRGGWSGREKEVLLCAFKQRQIVELKALVKGIDPGAFLIVCDAHEVLGDGFRAYKKDDI